MRNKFTTPPKLQTPPAVCKKSKPIPIPFNPCPQVWPPQTLWVVTRDLTILGFPSQGTTIVPAPTIGGSHWAGQVIEPITVGPFSFDLVTDVDYAVEPVHCNSTILIVLTGFAGALQVFQFSGNQLGVYNEGLPFVYHPHVLQAFPAQGTITVSGS